MCRYFEEEDEEDNMAYQPAPGSPGEEKNEESEEEDPLDAFMADIEVRHENIYYLWIAVVFLILHVNEYLIPWLNSFALNRDNI